jgi:raffinose/stachyose/melibiose transport system permease protein
MHHRASAIFVVALFFAERRKHSMERVMRNKVAVTLFLLPSFALFAIIVIIPIFMSVSYSTLEWNGITDKVNIGLDNYKYIFNDEVFWRATRNSFIFAIASVCIQLPFSMLLALVLANRVKGERLFVTIYFIPVILAAVVIGQLWRRIYNQEGLLNYLLNSMGFEELGSTVWLGDMKTALFAVLVPVLWQYVGYHMLLYYTGIKSISPELFEAARIDGAGFWRISRMITLPLLRPIIAVSLTFSVTGAMKVFDMVRILTDGGPVKRTEVLTTLMFHTMISPDRKYGRGSAIALVLIVLCFILYTLIGVLFRDREDDVKRGRLKRRHKNG